MNVVLSNVLSPDEGFVETMGVDSTVLITVGFTTVVSGLWQFKLK